jgi:hypothetical protein
MSKANPKETIPYHQIWSRVWNTLEEVSDESGEDDLEGGYLLKYEGWSGVCVEGVCEKVEAEQKREGIDSEGEDAEEKREEAFSEYAEEQSYKIIDDEWKPELEKRGYRFINGAYDSGGLYGITWALFKKEI